MTAFVALTGLLIASAGALGVIAPARLVGMISGMPSVSRFRLAIAVRFVLGAVFLAAAPDCRHPNAIRAIGVLAIAAGLGLLGLGRQRLDAYLGWWLDHPGWLVRVGCVGAIAFGGFLVYAARLV